MSAAVTNPALIPPGPSGPSPIAPQVPRTAPTREAPINGPSFADVLAKRTDGSEPLHFSRHALERLQRRGIDVSGPVLERLSAGVGRAAGKGARDAVVFVDGTAFVVSVRNNTVITAVGAEHMREHVFTNIDSAVVG